MRNRSTAHEGNMEMKRMRQSRFLSSWFGVVLLTVWALYVGVALADAPVRHYQVAVFTNGLTASPVLEGLQEGLAQLGYISRAKIFASSFEIPTRFVTASRSCSGSWRTKRSRSL